MEDTLELYDLAVNMLGDKKDAAAPSEGYAFKVMAFRKFYKAAKTLSETSLEQLKEEGVKTSLTDGMLLVFPLSTPLCVQRLS